MVLPTIPLWSVRKKPQFGLVWCCQKTNKPQLPHSLFYHHITQPCRPVDAVGASLLRGRPSYTVWRRGALKHPRLLFLNDIKRHCLEGFPKNILSRASSTVPW